MEGGDGEMECRICRGDAEESRPLCNPCKCTGSIGLVHQDCLEEWLGHSNTTVCELCGVQYCFEPYYDDDTPEIIPVPILMRSVVELVLFSLIPLLCRVVRMVVVWFMLIPLISIALYSFFVRGLIDDSILTLTSVGYGIVLDGLIALSMLVLMSFTDFVRLHWVEAEGENEHEIPNRDHPQQPEDPPNNLPGQQQLQGHLNNVVHELVAHELMTQGDRQTLPDETLDWDPEPLIPPLAVSTDDHELRDQMATYRYMERDHDDEACDDDANDEEVRVLRGQAPTQGPYRRGIAFRDDVNLAVNLNERNAGAERETLAPLRRNEEVVPVEQARVPPVVLHQAAGQEEDLDHQGDEQVNGLDNMDMDFLPEEEEEEEENLNDPHRQRNAILELVGLRGPWTRMAVNAFWITLAIGAHITLTHLPIAVGSKLTLMVVGGMRGSLHHHLLVASRKHAVLATLFDSVHALCQRLAGVLAQLHVLCEEAHVPMRLVDALYLMLGSLFTSFLIYSFAGMLSAGSLPRDVRVVQASVKVTTLLCVRIFLLPLVLGVMVLAIVSSLVLCIDKQQWLPLLAHNAVGALGLAWTAGISFMMFATVAVLQLREILHPAVLGSLIRPQESHVELVQALVHEPLFVHARQVAVTFTVYSLMVAALVGVPALIAHEVRHHFLDLPPLALQLWYWLPTVQLPLELVAVHLYVLALVEQIKDSIGRAIARFMQVVTAATGVDRYLLPFISNRTTTAQVDQGPDAEHDEQLLLLPRPPPGWDLQPAEQSTRWSWRGEPPSAVELALAPRMTPDHCALRCGVVAMACLVAAALALWVLPLVPLMLGRLVTWTLFAPSFLLHDFLHLFIGCKLLQALLQGLSHVRIDQWTPWRVARIVLSESDMLLSVLRLTVMRVVTYLCAGSMLGLLHDAVLTCMVGAERPLTVGPLPVIVAIVRGLYAEHPGGFFEATAEIFRVVSSEMLQVAMVPCLVRGALVVETLLGVGVASRWGLRMGVPPESQNAIVDCLTHPHPSPAMVRALITVVYDCLVFPPFYMTCLLGTGVVHLVTIAVLTAIAALPGDLYLTATYAVVHQALVVVFVLAFYSPLRLVLAAVRGILRALYERIRDANYLKGRRLLNLRQAPQPSL